MPNLPTIKTSIYINNNAQENNLLENRLSLCQKNVIFICFNYFHEMNPLKLNFCDIVGLCFIQ